MSNYKNQVALLLSVLPEVAKEKCFALHGGTAINLFIRDMPRLSVDIDLTYIPIEPRKETFANINAALSRVEQSIIKLNPKIHIEHKKKTLKLIITSPIAIVKVEVNQAMRGLIGPTNELILCNKAQIEFDAFCSIQIVPTNQLFGGKICAALDRQHPRDLFDTKYILNNEGFTPSIKSGFIFCLLASKRPIHEMLSPNHIDQRAALQAQFSGMTLERFTYNDYEETRSTLISTIRASLTARDKEFLLSFVNTTPEWSLYDYELFPAVKWKLQNLTSLKLKNPKKHKEQYRLLQEELKFNTK